MIRALFAVKNNSFDCVAISALLILELIRRKVPVLIEQVYKFGPFEDAHSSIMVNHTRGNLCDIDSLNPDFFIIDPWYRVCLEVATIWKDRDFFCKYPLLDPRDKIVSTAIMGNNPPRGYTEYLSKLDSVLFKKKDSICESVGLDVIFPRLP